LNRRSLTPLVAFVGTLALLAGPSAARAETVNCTVIPAVPYNINSPGTYCLSANLSTTVNGIGIYADDVVVDLNGHTIENLAGSGTWARGIYSSGHSNITIRNGTVRGFRTGVMLLSNATFTNSQGHVIEGLRVDRCMQEGIFVRGRAIRVQSNLVVAIGGSTTSSQNPGAVGISVGGVGNRVLDNDLVALAPNGPNKSSGISVMQSTGALVVGNRITDASTGLYIAPDSTGTYRDNLATDVAIPYSGGTDAGNNQ
jgi:hypothetical protein